MKKVGNFTKESVRNGALVSGGHRIKFVSDDKEFIILVNRQGEYQGFYLTYEKDGAYLDEDRTPAPGVNRFNSLDDCKKFFHIGEEHEEEQPKVKLTIAKKDEDNKLLSQYKELKAKNSDACILLRCGDFYETYEDDAERCAKILGITLTRKGKTRMAGFPYHALDTYLPRLVRAGLRIAICDQLEDPRLVKRDITEIVETAPKAEKVPENKQPVTKEKNDSPKKEHKEYAKLPVEKTIACDGGMEGMRKKFVKCCELHSYKFDRTCIKQKKDNPDNGLMVAYNGKEIVVAAPWFRVSNDGGRKYYLAKNGEYDNLFDMI